MTSYDDAMSSEIAVPEEASADSSALDRVRALESEYLLQNYARYPLVLDRGKGCYVFDPSGKRYLDFITGIGVNALGHAHPRLVKVIREQAGRLCTLRIFTTTPIKVCSPSDWRKLADLHRTFFCNSGAESMEGAMKMARAHGHKINRGKVRNRRAPQFLSRPDAGRAVHHRAGEVPQGF